jgi:hypothetical protein
MRVVCSCDGCAMCRRSSCACCITYMVSSCTACKPLEWLCLVVWQLWFQHCIFWLLPAHAAVILVVLDAAAALLYAGW